MKVQLSIVIKDLKFVFFFNTIFVKADDQYQQNVCFTRTRKISWIYQQQQQ